MNKTSAKEWLTKSWHNLSTALLLYDANHYTDIIAVEIHYSCEKSLKSFFAFHNQKILKTHDLYEVYKNINDFIDLEDHVCLLDQISDYHIEESYPAFNRALPSREEMKEVLDFAEELFYKICIILDINHKDVTK